MKMMMPSKRLRIVAGQVAGVTRMVEEGRDVSAILAQCKAIKASLDRVEDTLSRRELERLGVDERIRPLRDALMRRKTG